MRFVPFLLLINVLAHAQSGFVYTEDDENKNIVFQVFETDNQEYLLSFASIHSETDRCRNGIIKLSEDGHRIDQTTFCHDSLELIAYDFHSIEDSLVVIGGAYNAVSKRSYLWYRKMSSDFTVSVDSFYYLSQYQVGYVHSTMDGGKIHSVGVMMDRYPNIPFVAVLTADGQLLKSKADFDFRDYTNRLFYEDGKYIMSGNHIRVLDSDFNVLRFIYNPAKVSQQGDMIRLSDSTYLVTGKYHSLEGERDIGVRLMSDDFQRLDLLTFGLPRDTIDFPGFYRSISQGSNQNIYIGGTSNIHIVPTPYGRIPSWFTLAQIDPKLKVKWNKKYGGDAYYNMFGLLATSDGGCLIYGFRNDYSTQDPLQVYVLKVDEHGEQQISSTISLLDPSDIEFSPVPFVNQLNLKIPETSDLSGVKIVLYDSTGRLIRTVDDVQHQTTINTSMLPSGFYIAKVIDAQGKHIASRKLIKS